MIKKTVSIACLTALLGSSLIWLNTASAHSVQGPKSHHDGNRGGDKYNHKKHSKAYKKKHNYNRHAGHHSRGKNGKQHSRRHGRVVTWYPAPRHRPVYHGHGKHRYGHHRPIRYGHVRWSKDVYRWIAFTTITLGILDHLDNHHQRQHESAQIRATFAPVGQPVRWSSNGARGYVTAVREGVDRQGRVCREFAHEVQYQGQQRQTNGVACRGGDGVWNVTAPDQRMVRR